MKKFSTSRAAKMSPNFHRTIASALLNGTIIYPGLHGQHVTISRVKVTSDLKLVTAFFTLRDASQKMAIRKILGLCVPQFKDIMKKDLSLRYLPELRFLHDDELEMQEKTAMLLGDIAAEFSQDHEQ